MCRGTGVLGCESRGLSIIRMVLLLKVRIVAFLGIGGLRDRKVTSGIGWVWSN